MIPSHASLPLLEVASKLWRDSYDRCASLSRVGVSCANRITFGRPCVACEQAMRRDGAVR